VPGGARSVGDELTDAQRAELDRRLASIASRSQPLMPWAEFRRELARSAPQ
jgi:putative addiction module component (TIGR02574 family)